jgi:hypothetical protein
MEDFAMPYALRKRMRMYFHESREVHRHRKDQAVLSQLSPALQGEILLHLHKKWIREVWYFSHSDDSFVVAAAQRLGMCAFAQDEEVHVERTLFIVRRGICARASNTPFASEIRRAVRGKSNSGPPTPCLGTNEAFDHLDGYEHVSLNGSADEEGLRYCDEEGLSYGERLWPRVYAPGSFWGEDMLLTNRSLRDEATGRALTYLQVINLGVGNLIEIASRFPEVHKSLCVARTKMAVARAIRKLSWHLRFVRADAERERTFLALDEDQVRDLIADMLQGDSRAQYILRPTASTSTMLVRKEIATAGSLEGSYPAPKQLSHMLGRIENLHGRVARLSEGQDAILRKLDRVIGTLDHQTNGRAASSSLKANRVPR